MLNKHRVDPDYCPNCKKTVDAALGTGKDLPRKGDVNLCIYCGMIGTYDEDLRIERMSTAMQLEYESKDPQAWSIVTKAVKLITERNG